MRFGKKANKRRQEKNPLGLEMSKETGPVFLTSRNTALTLSMDFIDLGHIFIALRQHLVQMDAFLVHHNLDPDALQRGIEQGLEPYAVEITDIPENLYLTKVTEKVWNEANQWAIENGDTMLFPEHMLMGIFLVESPLQQELIARGLSQEKVEAFFFS